MAVQVELDARALTCGGCGSGVPIRQLVCPVCGRLVHANRLNELSTQAERDRQEGRLPEALAAWRQAQALLPSGSVQFQRVSERIAVLSKETEKSFFPPGIGKLAAGAGAAALFLWKFKFVAAFLLTKGKLLLTGLLNAKTLFSMLLTVGVYWTAWGWMLAVGLVATIYVHEIGHVAALKRLGIAAGAPMFIPGLGAFVRMEQYPNDAREDARVGLAGPLWGLGAGLVCAAIYLGTGEKFFAALAHVTALLNLFNLIPLWQLDGGRGFRALTRSARGWICLGIAAAWFFTGESLLILILLGALYRLFARGDEPARTDPQAFAEFAGLVALLSALMAWAKFAAA